MNSAVDGCRMAFNFFDTLFHFRVIHYFVPLSYDVILFAKRKENIQGRLCFQTEINSKKFSLIKVPL